MVILATKADRASAVIAESAILLAAGVCIALLNRSIFIKIPRGDMPT